MTNGPNMLLFYQTGKYLAQLYDEITFSLSRVSALNVLFSIVVSRVKELQ
jgi:hypothetical protein